MPILSASNRIEIKTSPISCSTLLVDGDAIALFPPVGGDDLSASFSVFFAIPLHIFREESLEEFQAIIKGMYLGDVRVAIKAYLKLFIEKIVINLPRIDITCKSNVHLVR